MNVGQLRRLIADVNDDALIWIAAGAAHGQRQAFTTDGAAMVAATELRPPVLLIEIADAPSVEHPGPSTA